MVVDAWSQMSHLSQLEVEIPFKLCKEINKHNLRIVANAEVMEIEVDSTLLQDIRKGQLDDPGDKVQYQVNEVTRIQGR
jgi:hypothetical protein